MPFAVVLSRSGLSEARAVVRAHGHRVRGLGRDRWPHTQETRSVSLSRRACPAPDHRDAASHWERLSQSPKRLKIGFVENEARERTAWSWLKLEGSSNCRKMFRAMREESRPEGEATGLTPS